jgi:hypothetical protein
MTQKPLSFPDKHADEVVIFIQHRHWSVLFSRMTRWVLLLILPIAVIVVLIATGRVESFTVDSAGGVAVVLGASVFMLLILLLAFQDWLDYFLDTLMLSNERVIQIEQVGMFKRTVAQLSLDKVLDVTTETKGILSSFFGFGTITVESAGEIENFIIKNMPHVEQIQSQILMYSKQAPRTGVER